MAACQDGRMRELMDRRGAFLADLRFAQVVLLPMALLASLIIP